MSPLSQHEPEKKCVMGCDTSKGKARTPEETGKGKKGVLGSRVTAKRVVAKVRVKAVALNVTFAMSHGGGAW